MPNRNRCTAGAKDTGTTSSLLSTRSLLFVFDIAKLDGYDVIQSSRAMYVDYLPAGRANFELVVLVPQ